jgi:hypothetical protein
MDYMNSAMDEKSLGTMEPIIATLWDPRNGMYLCSSFHTTFDKYLWYIDEVCEIHEILWNATFEFDSLADLLLQNRVIRVVGEKERQQVRFKSLDGKRLPFLFDPKKQKRLHQTYDTPPSLLRAYKKFMDDQIQKAAEKCVLCHKTISTKYSCDDCGGKVHQTSKKCINCTHRRKGAKAAKTQGKGANKRGKGAKATKKRKT